VTRRSGDRLKVLGRTNPGRYLTVIVAPDHNASTVFVVTAREITENERALYRARLTKGDVNMAHGTEYTEEELEALAVELPEHEEALDDPAADWTADDGHTATGSSTLPVRMPVSMIAALKVAAMDADVGSTVLAREMIAEGLARRAMRGDVGSAMGSVPVSEILQLAMSHVAD